MEQHIIDRKSNETKPNFKLDYKYLRTRGKSRPKRTVLEVGKTWFLTVDELTVKSNTRRCQKS